MRTGGVDPTFFVVNVNANCAGDLTVQSSSFVVVLGCEALLEPVVQVNAPGGAAFSQLVKSTQAAQGHPDSEGFAFLIEPNLPVMLSRIDHGVSYDGRGNRKILSILVKYTVYI